MSIPVYPKLYILNANSKVYEWDIKIELNKQDNTYDVITSHGQQDGKKVIHITEIKKGKAKRSILEQAILETNRKWQNKIEKELYTENLDNCLNINNETPLNVRPMLANTFSFDAYEKKNRSFKIPFPAYVQKKYDGIRCISYIKDNEVILESRKGVPFQNFNILKEHLKELFTKLPKGFYFDGELYTEKLDFEVISGLIRLHEKKCTEKDTDLINLIEYHIYDFIDTKKPELIYKDRYSFLTKFLNDNNNNKSLCKNVESTIVYELSEIKVHHDSFVQQGYEGIMIRSMDGIYETNKRSKYLQKFKKFIEEEFKIIGFHQGIGDELGAIVWDCITEDGKTFAVRPKGTFEARRKLFEEGTKNVGKHLTVIFQEYTSENIPRFPVGKGIRDIY